ncbi:hypothetical protein B7463_g9678, partial [Scytalidium lignicola]
MKGATGSKAEDNIIPETRLSEPPSSQEVHVQQSDSTQFDLSESTESNEPRYNNTQLELQSPPPYESVANAIHTLEKQYHKDVLFLQDSDVTSSCKGYESAMRQHFELDTENLSKLSLWALLKAAINLDLPIHYNEPLSHMQKLALDLKNANLLDIAAGLKDSAKRMVYVTAFALSKYISSTGEYTKPLNPLLGETYEFADPKGRYRFFAEQVRHHSPNTAVCAESLNWTFFGEADPKTLMHGRSLDIRPRGTWFVRLRTPSGSTEVYTWTKPTLYVKLGLVSGAPIIERYDPIEVKNWTTGEVGSMSGAKMSYSQEFSGKVVDAHGQTRYTMYGRWNGGIYACAAEESGNGPRNSGSSDSKPQDFMVLETSQRPEETSASHLQPFLAALNDCPDNLRPYLPPTDTRLRPDQRALENRQYGLAATEKHRIEELQRERARQRQIVDLEYVPRWFKRVKCDVTGEEYWEFDRSYWKEREMAAADGGRRWKAVGDIFSDGLV